MSTEAPLVRGVLTRLRDERGSAVVEFPMMAVLIVGLALTLCQIALFIHVRNGLTDAAVQAAHYGALYGNTAADGCARAEEITERRFAGLLTASSSCSTAPDGRIVVTIRADLPLVGFIGPHAGLVVDGHALNEDAL